MTDFKYPHIKRRAAVMLLLLCWGEASLALDPQKTINQYGHNVWFRQNGLPTNAVYVGLQGRDGFLWLGTSAGLFRFDGVNFTSVNTNPRDSKVIETISTLCKTKDSSLWVGTTFSGLRRIKNDKIFRYGGTEGVITRQIRASLESRKGDIWIGSSHGLYIFRDRKFSTVPISPNFITALSEDSLGRIWVGTHAGVRIFDGSSLKQVDSLAVENGLPNNMISSFLIDRHANVWIGTIDGLVRWKAGAMKTYRWTDGLADNHITSICEDRNGNIWFGTYKGISRFTDNTWSSMTATDGLTNNHVLNIFEDHEGSVWVCTLEGLNQFTDVSLTTFTTKEGLASDYVSSVVETPDHGLYFLSDADGCITRFKNNRITRYTTNVGPAYAARDGSLWIGQTGLLLNIKGDTFTRFDSRRGIPMKWISAIGEDSQSIVLYLDAVGLRRFVNGRLQPYLLADGQPYTSTEYVACFHLDKDGTFWIGTSNGLVRMKNGTAVVYSQADGLAGHWFSSIYDDGRGSMWITSPSDGLTRYKDGKFTAFTMKDGLFSNEYYSVLCDGQGDLWLSTPRGIAYLKIKVIDDYQAGKIPLLSSQVFTTADGMKSDECFGEWQPAGWKTQDGCLWFATKKGAVKIDPKKFKNNVYPPPVLIERIVVDQQASPPADQFTSFSPGKERWEFHYTALSYLVPDRVHFKYKLEGYDREWVDAGTRRVAYYTNLPPRDYRFQVMACNNDGVWNKIGTSYPFKLQPHFYEAYWFYGLVIMAIGALGFALYRIRVWQLLRREKELQGRIQDALANIKTLSGLLPICANCKKIRNDKGYWDQIEGYIQKHSEAQFTHGICPECAEKLYSDVFYKNIGKREGPSTRLPSRDWRND